MPSLEHEAIVQMLHRNPGFAAILLAGTGYRVPAGTIALADSNLPHPEPKELRSDVVVTVSPGSSAQLAIIAEPQTMDPNREKRRAWLGYLAVAGIEHDCDVVLMPITIGRAKARLCARPFSTGHPGLILIPVVIGPENTPHPDAPGTESATAELTVLGTLNGNLDLADPQIRRFVLGKLAKTGPETRNIYTRIIYLTAPAAVQQALEEDMASSYRVEFLDQPIELAEARGEARGEARMLLHMLARRGFDIPDDIRHRIMSCTDTAQIEDWADQALTATTLSDVFARP
jgi:hypothetical protein